MKPMSLTVRLTNAVAMGVTISKTMRLKMILRKLMITCLTKKQIMRFVKRQKNDNDANKQK